MSKTTLNKGGIEIATYKFILLFLALVVLCSDTTFGADASTENVSQIVLMEKFQLEEWGRFWTVDFQGERLFAAYAEGGHLSTNSKDFDLTKHNKLSRVLIDDDEDRIFTSGTPLKLAEGYELTIQAIDLDGNKVYVQLMKDGNVVNSVVVDPSKDGATIADKTYVYKKNLGGSREIVTIAIHFKNAFRGADQDLAAVDGIWQISEAPIEIRNVEVHIPQWRNFHLDDWGHFWAVDSLGVAHFAAYAEDSCLYGGSKDPDLTKHIQLSRVLIDYAEDYVLTTANPLELDEDYELAIQAIDLDGNKVYVQLLKGGRVVDAEIINAGVPGATVEEKTYTYTMDMGDAEDVVVIAVHFKSSFRGADMDVAIVDGIWQISETPKNV